MDIRGPARLPDVTSCRPLAPLPMWTRRAARRALDFPRVGEGGIVSNRVFTASVLVTAALCAAPVAAQHRIREKTTLEITPVSYTHLTLPTNREV